MIEVVISENGRVIDRLRFDADTLVSNSGDVATMHRGVMRELSPSDDLWQRVAHAAGYLAGAFKNPLQKAGKLCFRPAPACGSVPRPDCPNDKAKPQIEIEDDDLYRLQRGENECQVGYRARCGMLGCNHDGFVRLPRRT